MRRTTALCLVLFAGSLLACTAPAPPGGGRPGTAARVFQGRTAQEWGEHAKDLDEGTCLEAFQALREMGPEGVPYLLAGLESQSSAVNVCDGLIQLRGADVADADLPRVASYLEPKWAPYDDGQLSVRCLAMNVLGDAGPRARKYAPQIRELARIAPLANNARDALKKMGAD